MSGKSNNNSLLTGAGISFPFENFTNSALLVPVPVPNDISSLIPEDIEAESFLGQEPSSGLTGHKPAESNLPPGPASRHSDSTFSSNQLLESLPNPSPIPVFTQSYTGTPSPTKPTPLYADALSHQLSQSFHLSTPCAPPERSPQIILTPKPVLSHNSTPSPTPSLYHNLPPSSTTTSVFPRVYTPHSAIPDSRVTPSDPVTAYALHNNQNNSSAFIQSASELSHKSNTTPLPGFFQSPPPSLFTPLPSHSFAPEEPTSGSAQACFNYFSATQNVNTTLTDTQPAPPPHYPTAAPPTSGGNQANTYRLSNIKRPTYTRPPELSVAPTATMPSPMTPAQTSAALFTPGSGSAPAETNIGPPPIVSFKFSNQPPAQTQPTVLPPSFANLTQGTTYRPVYHHWFFKNTVENKVIWNPFSMTDSLALEQAFTSATISPDTKVPTAGGRYDVEVLRRRRFAVYWEEEPAEVRRCSWFFKGSMDMRYFPYEENVATMLEEEYRIASSSNEWNRHVQLHDGEVIVLHSPNTIVHHTRSPSPDVWGNSPQMQKKPRVVKRGLDEFDISDGEPEKVDHLLFLVHGIGKFCDLKFRPVTEVVDDFRSISLQLLQSHFKEAVECGQVGRVEVLPVSWHQALHSEHIDQRLQNITLKSIPRLRHFTNDTLLDILFYTSPVFCETIVQAVGNELNRLYNLFLSRNPGYQGGVSLGGHSLGSLILFDMLCNQVGESTVDASPSLDAASHEVGSEKEEEEMQTLGCMKGHKARLSRRVSYVSLGKAGTGLPFISYPQLVFHPKAFFALGSPIGMFVTVRGIESLGKDFCLPTCSMFFNIFHPFDPVAYRVESLIDPQYSKYSPLLIPHHKGRKRMHLELKDTLEHMGTALKQRLMESVRNTWNTVYQLAVFHRTDTIEQEVTKVLENEMMQSCPNGSGSDQTTDSDAEPDVPMGLLNGGRRIDYVLQEAPLESFNEYLFALSSHVCYWESEDTMLMMLKEIYNTMGVTPDSQVVHQILPFEDGEASILQYGALQTPASTVGMDPTAPMSDNLHVGPPPKLGFTRK